MATITIKKPFDIAVKGAGHFDALPSAAKGKIKATQSGISTFEYRLDGNTYALPTGGSASSTAASDSADLDGLVDVDTGGTPPDPFEVSFNTGTACRVPSSGTPYKVEIQDVDADLLVTGAGSDVEYGSGGLVVLDAGGSGSPTRKTP